MGTGDSMTEGRGSVVRESAGVSNFCPSMNCMSADRGSADRENAASIPGGRKNAGFRKDG